MVKKALVVIAAAALAIVAVSRVGALELVPGSWNLIGGTNQSPEQYAADHPECDRLSIYGYDAATGQWTRWFSYVPDYVNNIGYLPSGNGYWVICHLN